MEPDVVCYDVVCRECARARAWVREACNGWLLFALGAATGSLLGMIALFLWSATEVATPQQDMLLTAMLILAVVGGTMLVYGAVVRIGKRSRQTQLRKRTDANGIHAHLPEPLVSFAPRQESGAGA